MITLEKLVQILDANEINIADSTRSIATGYAGDFLSHVISKAPLDCSWFTIMNNVNVCAVATLADISCVVLCEGYYPDEFLLSKVKSQGVNLISTKLDVFTAVKVCSDYI